MSNKQQRLKEAYDYVRSNYPVHTQTDFAKEIKITRQAFSSAMNGNVSYLTTSLFQKICAAFPGTFNLDYLLTGEGELLSYDAAKASGQVVQESAPIDINPHQSTSIRINPHQSLSDTELYHKTLDLNAQIISDLRKDLEFFKSLVLDKDATIQDNAEQIISLQSRLSAATNELEHTKATLAAVRKNFDAKVAEVDQLKVELEKQRDPLARYPFTPGVADGDNDRTLIATDE